MNNHLRNLLLVSGAGLLLICTAEASTPVWTFSPVAGYPPTVVVNSAGMVIIKYIVTNQSHKMHILQMQPIQGIEASGCNTLLGYHESCPLTMVVNGAQLAGSVNGGPVLCEQGNPNLCYQPSPNNRLAITLSQQPVTLTPSVKTLALSTNCTPSSSCTSTKNAALTGHPRQISIHNTGLISATNVRVSAENLPAGTSISANTCVGTLAAGASCTITVTPGSVANADANNHACTSGGQALASTISILADMGLSSQIKVYVLGYGCQYQGGFLYAVDDTTPRTGSIGGKVLSLVNQAEPYLNAGPQGSSIIWSSNGSGATSSAVSYDEIPGIDALSTSANSSPTAFESFFLTHYTNPNPFDSSSFGACQGSVDGRCNTANILVFYNQLKTNYQSAGGAPFTASKGPTPLTNYAAGLCKSTINAYSDWYLPAICELDAMNDDNCPSEMQSVVSSLAFLRGDTSADTPKTSCSPPRGTDCLAGFYWSSTETPSDAQFASYLEYLSTVGTFKVSEGKESPNGVRCARVLTP